MDRFEQLVRDSTFATTILGNLSTGDFELVPLENCDALHDYTARKARGLCVLGVVALDPNGKFHTALDVPMSDSTASMLGRAFCELVAARFTARPVDAGAEWLEKLHSLPDPRED